MNWIKWLFTGKGVKKWLFLMVFSILLVWNGVAWHYGGGIISLCVRLNFLDLANMLYRHTITGPYIVYILSIVLLFYSCYRILSSAVQQATNDELINLYNKALFSQKMQSAPNIVAIGGGTGLSNFLSAVKNFTANLTAIVAVTDDGGSSGRLRRDLGILPPGDVRNCLIALSQSDVNLEEVLAYNFPEDSSLAGHNLGNLMMAGLMQSADDDFASAIERLSKVLALQGRVLPSTTDNVEISAVMADGATVRGETNMVSDKRQIKKVFLMPEDCKPLPQALEAIADADYIFIGPGSLYTSIITNLIVPGMADALKQTSARVYYICNIVSQPGEMEKLKASQYVEAINQHIGRKNFFNIIVNNAEFTKEQNRRLSDLNCRPVLCDSKHLRSMGLNVIAGDLINEDDICKHDQKKLSALIMQEMSKHLF
ncbi:MAG: gluconeogenesis factor YvcK family protein [Bacillota bacterium]|jgi:uncharacterized cofD-like protein